MLTKDDLLQIGGLLQPIYKQLDTIETNMVTKSQLEGNNRILGTLFKLELTKTTHEIIKAVKVGFQEVVNHAKRTDKKIEDHEGRLKKLEEEQISLHRN